MPKRVTILNDNREFLELMREILEPAGHVVTTLNGQEVSLGEVVASKPDLMLIDLRLDRIEDRLTGWDLVVLARSTEELRQVPIIVCTADRESAHRHGHEMQAVSDIHLLMKPFSMDEVEELVARLLERESSGSPRAAVPGMLAEGLRPD